MQLATQTIIVYRNASEQYMWESGAYGYLGIVILCILAGLILAGKIVDKFDRKFKNGFTIFLISGILAIIFFKVAIFAITYL